MQFKLTRRFARKENGSLSVEAVFALPMLVFAITATFVFWDAFKTLNISQKGTYTIADMLSRETNAVDADYLTSMHEVFDFLAGESGDNAIRVSVVTLRTNEATDRPEMLLVWSQGVGGVAGYTDLSVIQDRLPTMSLGEQLIVVESEQEWSPAFSVGLASYRFREVAISRPRFAPQLVWASASGSAVGGSV